MMSCVAFCRRTVWLLAGVLGLAFAAGCSGKSKSERLYEEGRLFYKNRKYFNAIDKYEEALKLQPENAKIRSAAAEAFLKSNPPKPEKAIEYAQLALDKDSTLNEARLTMGQAHLQMAMQAARGGAGTTQTLDRTHLSEASRIAGELLQNNDKSVEGRLLQARIAVLNGDMEGAERLFRGILETDKSNLSAKMGLIDLLIANEKFVEAEVLAREAAKDDSEGTPNPAFTNQLAIALLKQKRYEDAYQTVAPALTVENKNPELTSFLIGGQILFEQLGQMGKKVASVDPLVAEGATSGSQEAAKAEIAKIAERMGNIGTVMKGVYGTRPESWFIRGVSYELQANLQEAMQHYAQAVTRSPEDKRYRLALALSLMGLNDTVQAKQELSTLLKAHPGDPDARLAMARVTMMEGSASEAVMQLRELQLEFPNDGRIGSMLARILLLSDKSEDVEEGLALLVRLSGENGLTENQQKLLRARSNMLAGMSLSREGKHEEATAKLMQTEQMLREVHEGDPANVQSAQLLSELAQRRGDLFEALVYARMASKLDPQSAAREAALYARLGQFEAARGIYERLLAKQPKAVPYALELIEIEMEAGRAEQAVNRMEALMSENPDDFRLILGKAKLLNAVGRRDEAIALLGETHRKHPEQLGVTIQLARLEISRNRPEAAAELLRGAAQTSSDQLTLMRAEGQSEPRIRSMMGLSANLYLELALTELMIGQYNDATLDAQKAAQIDANTAMQAAILEAIAHLGEGQPTLAQDAMQKAEAQTGPKPASFPYLKALVFAAAGDASKGIDVVRNDAQMNPDTRELFIGLLQKQPAETLRKVAAPLALTIQFTSVVDYEAYAEPLIATADKVLETTPEDPFVVSRKAEALGRLGRHTETIALYEQIRQAMPEFVPTLRQLSMAHDKLAGVAIRQGDRVKGEEHLKQAESYARLAVEKAPNDGQDVQRLGMILQGLGRTDEANELYRRTIQIDPKNWTSYNNLAWNLAQAGQLDPALETAKNALQSAPAGGVARGGILDTLGWIEMQKGDAAAAVGYLREASLLAPNEPEIRLHYAQALEATGSREMAVAQLEAVLQATPGYARVGEAREMLRRLAPNSPYLSSSGANESATTGTLGAPIAGG